MTKEERLEWLKLIEQDIHVCPNCREKMEVEK